MHERIALSLAARLTVCSLAAAATGVVMLMVSGVFRTAIPPGLFILLIPAGLVAFGRWRWTPIIATLSGLFIFVSYFPSVYTIRLLDASRLGVFIGLWLQILATVTALVAAPLAILRNYRVPASAARRSA